MLTRKEFEKREDIIYAPYAAKSKKTRGRVYPEKEHEYRSVYQRDKDRIIYSTAFRRLEYKTQVFVNHEGDYYRTRLTHTLEVAQIARTIARALKLNEELVETIALAHDLGHTPFGHAGENTLADIMKDHGGFEHNTHGLRVVDMLEKRYPDFPGLNLTYEVREGIAKHNTIFDHPKINGEFGNNLFPLLEAQIVDLSDEIAYDNHDLDDGITSGLLNEKDLSNVELWKERELSVHKQYPHITHELKKYQVIKSLINLQVSDAINNTERAIKKYKVKNPHDARIAPCKIASFSDKMNKKRKVMRAVLVAKLYKHYRVERMSDKAARFIRSLFDVYINKPEQLPTNTAVRLKKEDKYRVICDYLAGMTDRYAQEEYKRFFEPFEKV